MTEPAAPTAVEALLHVSSAPDIETRARLYNEGYETAVAQGLADDPTLADDWLAEQRTNAARAALDEVAKRLGGLTPRTQFTSRDSVITASSRNEVLGEALVAVAEVRAAVVAGQPTAATGCDCPSCRAGDDQWCCRQCHELARGESAEQPTATDHDTEAGLRARIEALADRLHHETEAIVNRDHTSMLRRTALRNREREVRSLLADDTDTPDHTTDLDEQP